MEKDWKKLSPVAILIEIRDLLKILVAKSDEVRRVSFLLDEPSDLRSDILNGGVVPQFPKIK